MKQELVTLVILAIIGVAQSSVKADDHPGLTAADQAYSAEKYEEAAALYRRDAELGIMAAQVNLAIMYMDGQGVSQDYRQAATWFLRAAEQGNAEAQQNLGILYQEGKGVPSNHVEAAKWFHIAGSNANAEAIEKNLTNEQIAEARKLAADWVSNFKKTQPR